MKSVRFGMLAVAASFLATAAVAEPVAYDVDMSHANLAFNYNHLGYSTTDGRFATWSPTLIIDEANPANSKVDVEIDVNSLNTFWEARDTHLKSADLFDVAKFPSATFKSTKVEQVGEKKLEVTGDLTIRGITKPTVLEVVVNQLGEHPMAKKQAVGLDATTTIKRSDFGMAMAVPYVSDEVNINISFEATVK
ncbi:Protein YceI [Pseudovibrio sp. W64]|uniref:YceI family protein n=1 Tax=unclassified Pseudovibrio TaxID=2627060 RepID=UPI0007AEC687|nr:MULTISPECIES: YceI family protein [unclassified Pseudovibrio]KZK81854.1 Protein YceI [Pseudovibrio sp. W64]KZK83327.1 Protein YceI [Pseudovibrio sp. Ad13]KZK92023.1 Protein YceI [Pseudovibrio sp. Ad5]